MGARGHCDNVVRRGWVVAEAGEGPEVTDIRYRSAAEAAETDPTPTKCTERAFKKWSKIVKLSRKIPIDHVVSIT